MSEHQQTELFERPLPLQLTLLCDVQDCDGNIVGGPSNEYHPVADADQARALAAEIGWSTKQRDETIVDLCPDHAGHITHFLTPNPLD